MTRMSADDRRDLLVQAAVRVMRREGVAHTTTRAIVAEAGMPLGVFHYCFRSKEELVEQVMLHLNETSFEAVLPVLDASVAFQDVVHQGLLAYWDDVVTQPARHQLTYELTQYALRSAPGAATTQYDVYRTLIRRFLTAAAEATGVTWSVPFETVVSYLLAMIEGVTFQYLVDGNHEQGRATLMVYAEHLVSMTGPIRTN
jgi:AcrR family transcriptional regulator